MKRSSSNSVGKTVYIRNMSYKVTQSDLMSIFSSYGKVLRINMPMHESGKGNRGIAFIDMKVAKDADHAIRKMNGTQMDGRCIKVVEAVPKKHYDLMNKDRDETPKKDDKQKQVHSKPKRRRRAGLDLLFEFKKSK